MDSSKKGMKGSPAILALGFKGKPMDDEEGEGESDGPSEAEMAAAETLLDAIDSKDAAAIVMAMRDLRELSE